jgi:hypothetical protein
MIRCDLCLKMEMFKILHVNRLWIKQKSARNIRQQEENFVSLLADTRLKEKAGTHRSLVKIREAEILIVPMCVTETNCPLLIRELDKLGNSRCYGCKKINRTNHVINGSSLKR